jgi:hypothetical protein
MTWKAADNCDKLQLPRLRFNHYASSRGIGENDKAAERRPCLLMAGDFRSRPD